MTPYVLKNANDICHLTNLLNDLDLSIKWKVVITKVKPIRSIEQNKLMWSWLNCIANETKNSKDDLHLYFRSEFLGYKELQRFGKVPISTTELDTKQFTDYLEKIRIYSRCELNIRLPLPEDKFFDDFYANYEV